MKPTIKLSNQNRILCNITMPDQDNRNPVLTFKNIPNMVGIPFIFMTPKSGRYNLRIRKDHENNSYPSKPSTENFQRSVKENFRNNPLLKKAFTGNPEGLDFFINLAHLKKDPNILEDNRILKKVLKKNMLFLEGESSNFIYFIVSGKIKLFKLNESGKEFILDICKEGEFLGFSAVHCDNYHSESAMALENSVVILINKTDFSQLLNSNCEIAGRFMQHMSKTLAETGARMMKLAYNSARKRLAEAIVFLSHKYQNEPSITFERETLSSLSGLASESTSRIISEFKEEGLIERNNGVIKIINLSELQSIQN